MATIEDLSRIISIILLTLLSPFLALSCIIVSLYERLILNDQECIESRSSISRLYVRVVTVVKYIVTFLLILFGSTRIVRRSILYCIHLDASQGNLSGFSRLGFEPLFSQICDISLRFLEFTDILTLRRGYETDEP